MDYHSDDSSDPDTPEAFKSACSKRADSLRAVDVMAILHEKVAYLSGGRDPRGGPLLTFPACDKREKLKHTDYRPLLHYLTRIPCEEARDLGFTVVVDMRGSTWGTVKPVLKELHLTFAHTVNIVYIIKPDNFWQKQRTSLGTHKYKFETSLMSVGALCKSVDPGQLTTDFDGTLPYDHNTWIELRLAIEEFTACTNNTLDQLECLRQEVSSSELAEDATQAKAAVEKHKQLQARLSSPGLHELHAMGHRLLQRLQCDEGGGGGYDSGYSGRDSATSRILANPDLQACVPSIVRSLSSVEGCISHVQQAWQSKKHRLEQCLQLRMLEQDVEKMFDWLYHNREEFLVSYVEIGHTCHVAKHLQESHSQFTVACQKVYLNLNKILSVASHLIESGHYASQHIASLAAKLDQVWKEFAAGLDERSSVLALSVMFHQKAEKYIESVNGWIDSCNVPGLSNDIQCLEANIHLHQQLYETMCQAYTEVHSTSKKLLYQLDHLVQICSQLRRDTPLRSKHKKPRGKPSAYSVTPDGKVVYRGNQQQQQQQQQQQGAGPASGSSSASGPTSSTPPQSKVKSSGSPASDYSEGASHVLAVIHEILAHHRAVEQRWTTKKLKLHQRLALRLFQEDVKQVIDWLATHGEVFLCKNPGVGRNLAKARMYQKSHGHFEMVAQNTYTNAEKLLQAAEELAHTGECNPQEIYNVAQRLDSHITSFVARVHQRRCLLQLAVLFFTHEGELVSWLQEVVADAATDDVRGLTTIEAAEEALATLQQQQETTEDAIASTALEGQSLLQQLRSMGVTNESGCGSLEGVQEALERLTKEQAAIQTVWTARRIKLDLLLQLRLFQRDALQVLETVEECARDASSCEGLENLDQRQAEQLLMIHTDSMGAVQQEALQQLRTGHEIMQLLKTSGLDLECDSSGEDDGGDDSSNSASISGATATATSATAGLVSVGGGGADTPSNSGGEDSSGSGGGVPSVGSGGGGVASSRHSICSGDGSSVGGGSISGSGGGLRATTESSRTGGGGTATPSSASSDKVSTLVELLHSANARLESIAQEKQSKLEMVIQLNHFMEQAQQVLRWIHSDESMLSSTFTIPDCLGEAQDMSQSHRQFQVEIEKTHASVVQLRDRSAQLMHCESQQLIDTQTTVAKSWENLVTCAEDRYKLVQASIAFYKTAEQVCSVLESLERDYRRDDDWCQKELPANSQALGGGDVIDKASAIRLKIDKHQEQKESFLRACTLARKTAQTFLKYANRSLMYYRVEEGVWSPESKVRAILDDLMVKENNVLECWTEKKSLLDQCAQYINLENNAKVALDWIMQTGEKYLESHTSLGNTKEETEQLLKEHNMFKVTAKDTRENVKIILQLADKLVENGHKHATSIREWVTRVDQAYKNFSGRMDQYRMQLEGRLGICSEESKASLSLDRHSDPSLEHKMQTAAASVAKSEIMSEEKRRSARKKELIMKELIETERSYVKDLEVCVNCYLHETRQPTAPKALQGKEHIIFCNMEEILNFHKNTFLHGLEKYKAMPEDAGHCFVTYAHKFDIYVTYCKGQPESNKLLVSHAGNFYDEVQRDHRVDHPIPAYLIKPVQRITKYQLLLRELLACCEEDNPGEISEGLEVMQNVPKKANDALHLSMLEGCDIPIDKLGDVILQDAFQVWDPRQLLRKHRERHVFLFEHHVVFCKEVKDQSSAGSSSSAGSQGGAASKYQHKQRLVTSELGLSEHIDGDDCKFALWGGSRSGGHDSKMILRATSVETKQLWVRKLRQVIQDSYLSNHLAKSAATSTTMAATSSSTTSGKNSTSSSSLVSKISASSAASSSTATKGGSVTSSAGSRSLVAKPRTVVNATASVIAATAGAARGHANHNNNNTRPVLSEECEESLIVAADRLSLSSYASSNTDTSSERAVPASLECAFVLEDHTASSPGELNVSRGQYLEILDPPGGVGGAAPPPSIASSCSSSSNISSKSFSSNISSKSAPSSSSLTSTTPCHPTKGTSGPPVTANTDVYTSSKCTLLSSSSSLYNNKSSSSSSSSSSGVSSLCSSSSLIHSLAPPRDPSEWAFARLTVSHGGSGKSGDSESRQSDGVSGGDGGTGDQASSGGGITQHVIEEGYVPLSVLRLARSVLDIPASEGGGGEGPASPVAKRKHFNSRKWLPPQLRKLSQPGRSSGGAGAAPKQSPLHGAATPLDHRHQQAHAHRAPLKVGCVGGEMGNRPGMPTAPPGHEQRTHQTTGESGGEEGDLLDVELPPPMRVMQEPLTAAANTTVPGGAATTGVQAAASSTGGGGGGNNDGGGGSSRSSSMVATGGTAAAVAAAVAPGAVALASGAAATQRVIAALAAAPANRGSCASLSSTEPSTAHLASELENIVKETMEQHEGTSTVPRGGVLEGCEDSLSPPASASLSPPHRCQSFLYSGAGMPSNVDSPEDSSQGGVERELRKLGFVVQELVDTERCYVKDLADVVEGYMVEMSSPDHKMPEDLMGGKDKIVFGNIAAIYEWHRDFFCKNLEECVNATEKIGPVFIRSEKKFQIYIKYCQNKPKSEYIVSEFFDYFEEIKQKLGHKLQLSDLLIKPVQRLMKYQLLMRDLHKYTVRAGLTEQGASLGRALDIMTILPRDADHMMTVGRLQDFEGNIMSQGKLLHYGPLLVSEGDQTAPFRPRELVVFLFEQRIIFSECQKKRTAFSSEEYFCKSHLQMNKLSLDEKCDSSDPSKFLLRSTDPRKANIAFVCQGEDQDDHHTWTSQIRHLLQTQRDFLMAIQSPIAYQKEQTKHLIDANTAWEPIGLKGRRISAATAIETLAPAPRLPLEDLLPLPPQPSDDPHAPPVMVVTEATPTKGGNFVSNVSTAMDDPGRGQPKAIFYNYSNETTNLTAVGSTAGSARLVTCR